MKPFAGGGLADYKRLTRHRRLVEKEKMDNQKTELTLLRELVLHGFTKAASGMFYDILQSYVMVGLLEMQTPLTKTPEAAAVLRKLFHDTEHLLREMWLWMESTRDDESNSEAIRESAEFAIKRTWMVFCDTYDSEVQSSKDFSSEDKSQKQMRVAQMYSEIIEAVTGLSLVEDDGE